MGLLRFWLALAVVFEHSALAMGDPGRFPHHLRLLSGEVAVQSFYIISGFYISLILNEKYVGREARWLFLSNRFLRIYPAYWVMLLCTAIFSFSWIHGALSTVSLATAGVQLAMNTFLIGLDWQFFCAPKAGFSGWLWTAGALNDPRHLQPLLIMPQAWTLGVELAFYVVAFWLVRRSPRVIAGIMLASLAARLAVGLHYGLTGIPWNYRFFPFEIALFLAGNLAYRLYRGGYVQKMAAWGHWPAWIFYGITLFYTAFPLVEAQRWVFYTLVVLAIPLLFAKAKKRGWDYYLGELSYPIYISHFLVINLLKPHLAFMRPGRGALVVAAVTLVVSAGLLHWVQEPIERYRASRVKRKPQPQPEPAAEVPGYAPLAATSGEG